MQRTRSTPLVGRDRQLAVLDGLIGDVVAGRGHAVWIEGEPGIGKSSLLDAALSTMDHRACRLFRAAAHELSLRFPLRVLLECLQVSEASPDPLRAQLAARLSAPGPDIGAGDPVVPVAEGLLAFVDRLCADTPVVVAVDDLQWADDASLAVWDRLARSVGQLPLLLIAACRPVGRRDTLAGLRRSLKSNGATMLPLKPLTADQSAEVISGLLGAEPGPGLRGLAERAGGNPLYLREIIDALVREEQATLRDGVADVAPSARRGPASLSAAIADRLGFLTRETADTLRIAALLGAEFAVADLAGVTRHNPTELIPIVEEGLASGVLTESGTRLMFRHSLIRDALADGIPAGLRSALRLQAARAMIASRASAERVAEQLLAATGSEAVAEEWVVDWLVEAGQRLVYRAPAIAADLLAHTIDTFSSTDPRQTDLVSLLVTAAWLDGRDAEVEQRARQFLAADPDPARKAQVAWTLGYVLGRTGRVEEATAVALDTLADQRLDATWRARLRALHAIALSNGGRTDDADVVGKAALAEAEQAGDLLATGYALHALSNVRLRNPNKTGALAYLERGVNLVHEHPDTMDLRLLLLLNLGTALEDVDRLDEALRTISDAVRLAEHVGSRIRRAQLRSTVGELLFATGQWDDAITELEILDAPYDIFRMLSCGILATIAAHRDDRATTDQLLGPFADIDVQGGENRMHAQYLMRARAIVAERDGDPVRAKDHLALMLDHDWDSDSFARWIWLPDLARLAVSTGDAAATAATLSAAEADAATAATPGRTAGAERCRGLVEGDPALLLSAAGRYRAVGRVVELAATLEEAALLLAQRGDTEPARAPLDEALSHYSAFGAAYDLRRAASRLRPFGLRQGQRGTRRRPTTGWDALTPTELRVAGLVAEGGSNPDIAAAMFLSRRTVQTHISHILAKLSVRSRIEIAQEAGRHLATHVHDHRRMATPS